MTSAIILAGGKAERYGGNKCFTSLNGKPVIDYSLGVIEPLVDEVIVVSPVPYKHYIHAQPGKTRGQSVSNGLEKSQGDYILIHDAVRPFITSSTVRGCLEKLKHAYSVATAVPVVDGLMFENEPLSKKHYSLTQTPEAFDRLTLVLAFSKANKDYESESYMVNDVLRIAPEVNEGVHVNSKITFPSDLPNAEGILKFTQKPIQTTPNLKNKVIAVYGAGDIAKACIKLLLKAGARVMPFTRQNWYAVPKVDGYLYAAGNYADSIMEINFEVPLDILSRVEKGNIVFLSSTAATYGRREALYSASKAALNSLIESKHEQLANKGVYVNAIAPARVKGKLQKHFAPTRDQDSFLDPLFVADWCLKYLDTTEHGHILYLRN